MHQSHEYANGGGLARAVRPDETHDLALRDLQIDIVERKEGVFLPNAGQLYG